MLIVLGNIIVTALQQMKLLIASILKSQGVNAVRDPEVECFETN